MDPVAPSPATDGALPRDPAIDGLTFGGDFRKYQRLSLLRVGPDLDGTSGDRRIHVVSPPGSGKTILGLEMIRRVGARAVVFAPTTTIQRQWAERVELFGPSGSAPRDVVGMDPGALKPINVFTYQLIAAPAQADEYLERAAREHWVASLVDEGGAETEEGARARVATIEANNKDAYRREIARRAQRVKRDVLRNPSPDIAALIHPNARKLIDDLVDSGVRTVVLDECHHLLDYWAVVLAYLIGRITNPTVIGLTATLPSPDDGYEYENYTGLLGDVDYEVPTPAVVMEGDLAPYRDLVYFVAPTPDEEHYIANVSSALDASAQGIWDDARWGPWLESAGFGTGETAAERWLDALKNNASVAIAALRHLSERDMAMPEELPLPPEAFEPSTLDDRLALLARYGLDELKLSADPEDHRRLAELRKAIRPFGMALTEVGLRQTRSPVDLILSYSAAKADAAGEILADEEADLGFSLRSVVVTDYERTGAESLARGAPFPSGSARQVFLDLINHRRANDLDPVLVTGKTLWIDADHADEVIAHFNAYLSEHGFKARCAGHKSSLPGVVEIEGEGRDWGSGTYVQMVTAAFELGVVRCLVGTRGLFAEGWDTLTLNTLIDLTTATTATAAQQLRGRSIRIDPGWKRKVAHNWDVICVAPKFPKGDEDFKRLSRRHARTWGIVPGGTLAAGVQAGHVVKGLMHVDPALASPDSPGVTDYEGATGRSRRAIGKRDASYDLWRVGAEYSNFSYSATRLWTRDLTIRTVYTVSDTLKKMLAEFTWGLVASIVYVVGLMTEVLARPGMSAGFRPNLSLMLAVLVAFVIAVNAGAAWRIARRILREQPTDTVLLDVGRAVLGALRDCDLVSPNLQPEFVRVVEQADLSYDVLLDYASPADAEVFITAYREVFEPLRNPRYLVMRNEARLPEIWLRPMWSFLRIALRPPGGYPPAYHAVPTILATTKHRAEVFARRWAANVGSGVLIYTRGLDGWRLLMAARAQRRPKVGTVGFEEWR